MKTTAENNTTLIDELLAEQRTLTAVERFSQHHDRSGHATKEKIYSALMPARSPNPGEQYAFQVDLDSCSGCKACVAGCHSLNGLDENETWREVGLLIGDSAPRTPHSALQQTITTACHHCVDPGCLNGCPVKAYDKDPVTGIVRHLDDQCMGCQYCVLMCPYEVPKYSEKLGIVRKCDMCVSRLAVGEAPACVQSCPNGAITITLVEQNRIRANFGGNGAPVSGAPIFLADSPNPKITLPTTQYISKRALQNMFAADTAAPRLDQPHWPLVIMLVFTQAAVGVFLAALCVPVAPALLLTAFALMNIGLGAAPLHLGRPAKAWRAFLGWRTSWLSRELIAFNQFAPLAAAATALAWLPFIVEKFPKAGELLQKIPAWLPPLEKLQLPLTLGAVVVGLGSVAVSAMVYAATQRACWSPRHSFGAFFGTVLLLGPAFAGLVFAVAGDLIFARVIAAVTLVVAMILYSWRELELSAALKDLGSPIHLNARATCELLPQTVSARRGLFIVSAIFAMLAIANVGGAVLIWTGALALASLVSEIIGRYVYFRAGAGKKMPGGIAA